MSDQLIGGVVTVAVAIVGVAIIAVLVGSNARTSQVVSSLGSAFSGALNAAEGPVMGNNAFGGVGVNSFGSGF